MAGYSGTPLPKKLGVREHTKLMLLNAPKDFEETLGELPEGVRVSRRAGGNPAERVIVFIRHAADVPHEIFRAEQNLAEGGGLWVAWPKQTSGVRTDMNKNHVLAGGQLANLVDFKVCAIDDIWSGHCFARRSK